MHRSSVPVSMGSPRFIVQESASLRVTEAWFPAGAVLHPHTHDRAILAIMLRGGFETHITRRQLACDEGFAWTEPIGERHANYVGDGGAHALVLEPDRHDDSFRVLDDFLDRVHLVRDAAILGGANAILAELGSRDAFTPLAIEGHALVLLAGAGRLIRKDGDGHRAPGWLTRVRERLHDEWRSVPALADLARTAGVHPTHLAHAFRAHYGTSVGSYLRQVRLNWAVTQLGATQRPISRIAAEAGFSDQSHFTRLCRRRFGMTPAAYRLRVTGDDGRR